MPGPTAWTSCSLPLRLPSTATFVLLDDHVQDAVALKNLGLPLQSIVWALAVKDPVSPGSEEMLEGLTEIEDG